MSFGKRASTPMTRADWAWVLTCIFFATIIVAFAAFLDYDQSQAHYGEQYTFTTSDNGKTESSSEQRVVSPVYRKCITIETNGDVQKIILAAHNAAPDSFIIPSSNVPTTAFGEYFADWFGCVLGILMVSYFFRIMEKLFLRLLGGGTAAPEMR